MILTVIMCALVVIATALSGYTAWERRRKAPQEKATPAPRTVAIREGDPIIVTLGNDAVAHVTDAADEHGLVAKRRVSRPDLGRRHTTFGPFPADWPPSEMIAAVAHAWGHHSDSPPAWLEGNDPAFEALLAAELKCPVGCPADWQEDEDA